MKPELIKLTTLNQRALHVRKDKMQHFPKVWHYHKELEIVLVIKSTGTRFIGDNIEEFAAGDLVFVGSCLPHSWQSDRKYLSAKDKKEVEAIIIHFNENFPGKDFLLFNEMRNITGLISRSQRGIKITGKSREYLGNKIKKLLQIQGFDQVVYFLKILEEIANTKEYELLASTGFFEHYKENTDTRIEKVYEYAINNISNSITLGQVAAVVNMNGTVFCRFFKQKTKKTFTQFLNETRIGYACKLLMDNKGYNIRQIAYECGYDSISNFNRQFKKIAGKTPKNYKAQF